MSIIKIKRISRLTVFLPILFIGAFGCNNSNNGAKVTVAPVTKEVLATSTLLATISEHEKADTPAEDQKHTENPSQDKKPAQLVVELNKRGRGFAYIAKVGDGVHVVHNGIIGKSYSEVASNTLTLSPDGQRVAYCAKSASKWYVIVDKREYGPFDEKGPPVFSPNSQHVAFESQNGNLWNLNIEIKKSDSATSYFEKPAFSENSDRILSRENTPEATSYQYVFSDISFKNPIRHTFKGMNHLVNETGSKLAVVDEYQGKNQIKLISFEHPDKVVSGTVYDEIRNLVFSRDGEHLAYIAKKNGTNFIVFDGKEEAIPAGEYPWPPVIKPDYKSVGLVIVGKKGAFIHDSFSKERVRPTGYYKECADLTYSKDGKAHAYVAIKNEHFLIVSNGKEGPVFDRVISPQFSPDGKFLVYRARIAGKRFVVVADATGKIIKQHPGYERVFETTFTEDGKSVAYGVKDGNQIWWKVEKL